MQSRTRFFEIIPGALVWVTFILLFWLSFKAPVFVSVFFILYSLFWLARIVYLHFHLRFSFAKTRENLKIDWRGKLEELERWRDVYHLVILPMYKEPLPVVRETFLALRGSNYPKDKIMVVLGTEEGAGGEAASIAESIKREFGKDFFRFLITRHPEGIEGEIPGKGSNETWAGRRAKDEIIDPLGLEYEKIIVSVLDVDTQVPPEYFGRLTYVFRTCGNPQRSSYQPIPLFTNNIYQAPAFSKVMSFFPTFWQMMQQSREEQLSTFTSQAMPFKALVEVGFWDTDYVSEDSLIFWKFYLHYDGNWRTEPLYFPVSMDATDAPTFWGTVKNLYRQQRRWAWGVENIPYMLSGFAKNKKIPFRKKAFWTFVFMEGFYSWATSAFILFILGWLPLFVGSYEFGTTLLSYNVRRVVGLILNFSNLALVASAVLSIILLPSAKPNWFRRKHYVLYFLSWALAPLLIIVFSAIPAVEAQSRLMLGGRFRLGFWPTPKSR
ncbi:MAG: glycosyltransferase family 2 protein [Candidatus Brennerbacteria bacterium]|nr:glycosyltransferase family 2 protein [Candidatus Brennerbacteria bacterium]